MMSEQKTGKPNSVNLQILDTAHNPKGSIRKSKSGKRRAIVLGIVQLLIIAHIVQWFITGKTSTPIEPSESMEFAKHGVINAGLIFFVIALLSTLILGRWFCGWGCHLVLLQDLCGWLMKKLGIRPRLFRSRLLIYVPLIIAIYMFIWPAFYRWGVYPNWQKLANLYPAISQPQSLQSWPGFSLELTTTDFLGTFAGLFVAIPFLFICGFASVYFLGAKGFCTYGCPYGGFFAPLDELAPARIRVTDDCEQSGHCTAVCTSNVRVHEEVREFGMVVNPGCMKCLDCVSVCPNDALYFGFGKPAIIKGKARFKQPSGNYDLTTRQEIALFITFWLSFFAANGLYGLIPMLFALGTAGITTFLVWKVWQILCQPNVRFHKFQFKQNSSIKKAGWIFTAMVTGVICVTTHSAIVHAVVRIGEYHEIRVQATKQNVFTINPLLLSDQKQSHAQSAIAAYSFVSFITGRQIGILPKWQSVLCARIAILNAAMIKRDEAEAILLDGLERFGPSEPLCQTLALVYKSQLRHVDAIDFYKQVLSTEITYSAMMDDFVTLCQDEMRFDDAIEVCRKRLEIDPKLLRTMRWLSLLLIKDGHVQEGIDVIYQTLEIDPNSAAGYAALSQAHYKLGQDDQAEQAMHKALDLDSTNPLLYTQMAILLDALGRPIEADEYRSKAEELK